MIESLGKGGFGTVYRAELVAEGGLRKEVALQVLSPEVAARDELLQRFRDEARILGLLRHRAVVKVDALVELDRGWAVVMEYVHGVNVSRLVKRHVPLRVALGVVEEVASALHEAYVLPNALTGEPLRLIHRDIKPANVRVTAQGEVKVLDFGVAKATFGQREANTTAMRFGSQRWMAPERIDGVDAPAGDVFALGLVLAVLVAGKKFDEPPTNEGRYQTWKAEIMQAVGQTEVAGLVERMLAYDHEARPDAYDVVREVRELATAVGGPSLREWCEHCVPEIIEAHQDPADPDSTIFVERSKGTPVTAAQVVPPPTNEARNLALLATALGLMTVVVAGITLYVAFGLVTSEPEPVVVEHPEPERPKVTAKEPVAVDRLAAGKAAKAAVAKIRKAKARPEAAPKKAAKASTTSSAPSGTVSVKGDVPVTLTGGGKSFQVGAKPVAVPAGIYTVKANFDGSPSDAGKVPVAAGETVTLACNPLLYLCSKR